jgi:predicted secreted hydrolase
MHPEAVGWDWIGMNLQDGSALTAFRLRSRNGRALWDGGSFRVPGQRAAPTSSARARWCSARSASGRARPARPRTRWNGSCARPQDFYTVRAVIDNQELDSRASTGAIYWEGLSELLTPTAAWPGGYLEMTGYAQPLRL